MASKKGRRYTTAEKTEALDWANEYNVKYGRGGVANASKYFGITQVTIHSWVRQGGATRENGSAHRVAPNHSDFLRDLADLTDKISEREKELKKLRSAYHALHKKH